MVKTLKAFVIDGILKVESSVTISAESLEDAIEQSKTLNVADFVKFKSDDGSYSDGNLKIRGVWEDCREDLEF